jgi:hypothetical protein
MGLYLKQVIYTQFALHAPLLVAFGLLFDHEDGSCRFLRNTSEHLLDCTGLHPRR